MSFPALPASLILASTSSVRKTLLEKAGLIFTVQAPDIDETPVKRSALHSGLSAGDLALLLAKMKAEAVSLKNRDLSVIGADQTLECDGVWFDKPESIAAARDQLGQLRGRTHHLWTAVAVAKDGQTVWSELSRASLTMRSFSSAFLDDYLAQIGVAALSSVGCYQLEGLGIGLFERIDGDYFAILGLVLLPLLQHLRQEGAIGP